MLKERGIKNLSLSDKDKKNVDIKIVVGQDTIYDKAVSRDTDKITETFEAKGNVTIKVYINSVLANKKSYTMDMNSEERTVTVE